jgi:alpha/beta superfamily hydrolase
MRYAVLRYDNRGVKESSGEYINASDNEFASDAAAALKWLREESGIPIASSGFLGHSQGGIKSLIAADLEKPDYIISIAGVGIETGADTILRQNQEIVMAKGVKQSITDQRTRELTKIFEILRSSKDRSQARI